MQHESTKKQDYYRAKYLLNNRLNNVNDMLRYWAFSGPCMEKCPMIEKIKTSEEFDV